VSGELLLRVERLAVRFDVGRVWWRRKDVLRAVEDVSFELRAGEALGLVGESGCGKSTLARAVLQLVRPTSGTVVWLGQPLETLGTRALRPLRSDLTLVFQDPLASLDPRMTVGEIVGEPLRVHRPDLDRDGRRREVRAVLERVGLAADSVTRYPHEFSGGQCQRIGIARAVILKPKLLVCDEPVSALDVSIQAQIVNLLAALKRETGMSLLFVSHNLAVVRRLCDRVVVLYLGRMLEAAPAAELFADPRHPYTRGLLDAVPVPDAARQPARLAATLGGEPPSPLAPPSGCVFRTRCPHAIPVCAAEVPPLEQDGATRQVACHRWRELAQRRPASDGRHAGA
jgi:oligopeptide transport system ATP-binding protein